MAVKNKLAISLVKEEITEFSEIIEEKYFQSEQKIRDNIYLYTGVSYGKEPEWFDNFFHGEELNKENIFTANARAILLVKVQLAPDCTRIFVITFGYGKNMLIDDILEERFGLKVLLNIISPDSLRKINMSNIGGNQKNSSIQMPTKSGISDFSFDFDRDLLTNITAITDIEGYAQGSVTGNDSLYITAECDLSNIEEFLLKTYEKSKLISYKENFGWIDQIQAVKNQTELEKLNAKLIEEIKNSSENFWMAVPEVINWEDIAGFRYSRNSLETDIFIDKVKSSLQNELNDINQLKNKTIKVISSYDGSTKFNWSAYKCIYGEITFEGNSYCINNGKWYKINVDYVNRINDEYSRTMISNIEFQPRTSDHTTENAYTKDFVDRNADKYIELDAAVITYGGGHSSVELCDLLSKNKELIHLKPYSGSSTLSHLFNQALVSTELLLTDSTFLSLANDKIKEKTTDAAYKIEEIKEYSIVFGIISKHQVELPKIPFFSKVAFLNVSKKIGTTNKVYIKNIIDER